MGNLSRYNFYLQCVFDIIAILISYTLAFWWKFLSPFNNGFYKQGTYAILLPAIIIAYLFVAWLLLAKEDYSSYRLWKECKSVLKSDISVTVIVMVYMFFAKVSESYSREFIITFIIYYGILCLIGRNVLKRHVIPLIGASKNAEQLVLVSTFGEVENEIRRFEEKGDWRVKIVGAVLTDVDMKGEYINGVRIIAGKSDMVEELIEFPVDSVVITLKYIDNVIQRNIQELYNNGKTVHIDVDQYHIIRDANAAIDMIADRPVVSYYPIRHISKRFLFIKRSFDIIFALILLIPFVILFVLTAIFENLESRGPILTKRIRVGKNGRRFLQYRFRIFRMDAEERIEQGKNPKMIWGRFLSFSHLDRFPLILNVLLSDMSFIGIHAPRLPRFLEYSKERRKNMIIRPGIIGSWSFKKSEEEIISEERAYIEHWGVLKDVELFFEFLLRYITGRLLRGYDERQSEEEIEVLSDYKAFREPLAYDRSKYQDKSRAGDKVYLFIKRTVDIVLSGIAIVILSPLFLLLMILVMLDDGGSPFYGHVRIGKYGKRIRVYKFRSMRQDAGNLDKLLTKEQLEQYKREFKIDNDPRITSIGNFLRKSSLDELPQLFNIFSGSLSIVGPRPIVEAETKIYGDDIAKLLSVKPGLTGYWQAYARNNATYESGERQKMEMYYVEHRSLWLDIKIIFKTFSSVIKREGAQ
jgi:lipopolysaccharide/colanic/teichoic acid biosynthesis glycosyltransferase